MEHIIQSGVNIIDDEEEINKITQKYYEDIFDKLGQEIRKMKTMSKSDLKTGYILTFDDGRKGIVIKDINGDTSQSLILFIKDNKVDDFVCMDTTSDDLYCRKGAYREKNIIKVEKLEDGYLLGGLLKPSWDLFDINSIPKTVVCYQKLRKGDTFYTITKEDNKPSVIECTIDDIYITSGTAMISGTTIIVDTKGNEYNIWDIYATKSEAVKACCI